MYTTSALRWDHTKPHGVSFSLSIALVFHSFSYFVFGCTFFALHFVKHKEKHLKCMRICKLSSCFYFPCSGWRKWPEVKFHLLSNARERAHESVNGPLKLTAECEKPLRELIADEQDCFYGGIACWNLKKCRKLRTFAGTSRGSCSSIKYSRSRIKRSSGQLCIVVIRTLFLCLMLTVNKSSCRKGSFLLIGVTFVLDIQEKFYRTRLLARIWKVAVQDVL